jgi:hypothetical protein
MRAVWSLAVVAVLALVLGLHAEEKKAKKVKLTGHITCGKCTLKLDGVDECATVIQVKPKKGKAVVYFFDADSHKKYHKDICKKNLEGTVTGTVTEEDGKKIIKVATLAYKKKKDED